VIERTQYSFRYKHLKTINLTTFSTLENTIDFTFISYYNAKYYKKKIEIDKLKNIFDPASINGNKFSRELVPPNHRHKQPQLLVLVTPELKSLFHRD
jgi:hypothetical protein